MPTNEELTAVAVGDTVMVTTGYRGQMKPDTVTKVGRTLIHTSSRSYYKEDGSPRDGYSGRLLTMAQYHDQERRTQAVNRMRSIGFDPRSGSDLRQWSTDQLVALAGFAEYLKTMNQDELAEALERGLPLGY